LSWQAAREAAAEFLAKAGFPKRVDVSKQVIDLRPHLELLEADGPWRAMVLQAAARILVSRGADHVITED
jgi:hypothetical protein